MRESLKALLSAMSKTKFTIVLETPFEIIRGKNGAISMVLPEQAAAIKSKRKPAPIPKEPPIKRMLEQALAMRDELAADSTLTRSALARTRGLAPTVVTRLLHLANLVPEIQDYIRSMPASMHRGRITLRRLLPLSRTADRRFQLEEFHKLLPRPVKSTENPKNKDSGQYGT